MGDDPGGARGHRGGGPAHRRAQLDGGRGAPPRRPERPRQERRRGGEANVHFATDDEDATRQPRRAVGQPSVKGLPVPAGDQGGPLHFAADAGAHGRARPARGRTSPRSPGSGAGGRVTVEDLERFLDYIEQWPRSQASPMRLAVADAMRRSWTRPLATVGLPVLMDRLLDHRRQQDPEAAADALRAARLRAWRSRRTRPRPAT